MANKTGISWTDATWNPVTGCSKVSLGCQNCYAEKMAERLQAMGSSRYIDGFKVRCHENALNFPYTLKKPSRIFVNSMSDLFHGDVPREFIHRVFNIMEACPHHIFQVLTKRPMFLNHTITSPWPDNVWMGVTVESGQYTDRIDALRECGAHVKFLSIEPLVERVGVMNLEGIDWVIVGGESGPNARPMHPDWVLEIRDQCVASDIPFFFKQWGEWLPFYVNAQDQLSFLSSVGHADALPDFTGKKYKLFQGMEEDTWNWMRVGKKEAGRLLNGQEWNQFPKTHTPTE